MENYDPDHKLSFESAPEKYHAQQFLFFQASGQGPYFGQAAWFNHFHPEKLPSAQDRYQKEIVRVSKVLDMALEGKEWLVGGKCSYADLSFVPWATMVEFVYPEGVKEINQLPNYKPWMDRMLTRPAVKKILEEKAKASKH